MTSVDWCHLRDDVLAVSNAELSRRVGVTKDTGAKYAGGSAKIPLYVALACAAIVNGLAPYGSSSA